MGWTAAREMKQRTEVVSTGEFMSSAAIEREFGIPRATFRRLVDENPIDLRPTQLLKSRRWTRSQVVAFLARRGAVIK